MVEEEEERRFWSWSISPLLESSMETAGGRWGGRHDMMASHFALCVCV